MEDPRPGLRKVWALQSMQSVSPRFERGLGRLAFAVLWVPLIVTSAPLILDGTPLADVLKPVGDVAASLLGYTCLGSAALSVLLLVLAGGWTGGAASVGVDSRSLYILRKRERRIPRGLIAEGLVRPGVLPEVELHLTSGEILRLGFMNQANEDAQAVLDALGLGPGRRRVAIALGDRAGLAWRKTLAGGCTFVFATVAGTVLAVVAHESGWQGFSSAFARSLLFLVLGAMLVAMRSARYPEIVVGAEGLVIKRPWSTMHIRYAQLRDVVVVADGRLLLRRKNGKDEVLQAALPAVVEAVVARVNEAMDQAQRAEPVSRTDWLDRRGRSLANWRASVVAALRPSGGYRAPAHAPDDALRILQDPKARAEQRIGAALALVGSEHRGAAEKVRIAAEACADDKLRVALAKVTGEEPDLASIEAVLAGEAEVSAEVEGAAPARQRSP